MSTDRSVVNLGPMADPKSTPLSPPADTRIKILETAEALFARSGFEGVGMRELAAETGLSKSSLFHHFATKLELYEEVLSRVLERIEDGLDTAAGDGAGPVERLDAWIDAVVRTLAEDAPAARLLMRALVEQEPLPLFILAPNGDREMMDSEVRIARIIARLGGLIDDGVAAGVFRPISVPDAIQTTIGAVVFHFASGDVGDAVIGESIFSRPAVDRRRVEVVEFIRRGLTA